MIKTALIKLKEFFFYSKSFDDVTRRLGAVLLLLPCFVGIPLGLHRPFLGLGWKDWYLLPTLFAISCCGTLLFVHRGEKGWVLLTAPYTLAIAHEFWLIVTVPLPFPDEGKGK